MVDAPVESIAGTACLFCKKPMGKETRTYFVFTRRGVPWPAHLTCAMRGPLTTWVRETIEQLKGRTDHAT